MTELNYQKVISFIQSLLEGDGSYRFSPHVKEANSLSTCFALLTNEILNHKPEGLERSLSYLRSFQVEESGLFVDNSILKNLKGTHDTDYISHQVTYHILMVLDAFGSKPKYQLKFLNAYKDETVLTDWLERLNWSNPWLVSNNVMFVLNFFIYQDENENRKYIDTILDWLDTNQSSLNGMWNMGKKSTLHNQMAGAFHFQYFYDYLKRPKKKIDLIVDKTLLIQEYDGLFSYASGGGSCDDLDGVDLLCRNYHEVNDSRKARVSRALLKARSALFANQNTDGGFCWAKRTQFKLGNVFHLLPIRLLLAGEYLDAKRSFVMKIKNIIATLFLKNRLKWQFSGIEKCKIMIDQSDVFSTWFRVLSIVMIDKVTKNELLNVRNNIGIGYLK
ncbi:hypothetical protein [Vibrio crassostreae]|uniref:hypothetical protein n=1 Tax=Vibrio crassostreae TaxID=246167 RepID=UPI002FDF2A71